MSRTDHNVDVQSLADCVWLACVLEASARKPGNVHPGASFADLTYGDFLASARLIAPILARAAQVGVGPTVLSTVEATHARAPRNSNLGIVLLIAPLAAVPRDESLVDGLPRVLNGLSLSDADAVYQAIRLAAPGGMGQVESQDVMQSPIVTLIESMRLAADRDTIAAQYTNGFPAVLGFGLPVLERATDFADNWERAIVELHLRLMAEIPDTLIARKCGRETAQSAADQAAAVLDDGWPETDAGRRKFAGLDQWLRADGNRRNPGTTADVVAACLFAGFREGTLAVPDLSRLDGFDLFHGQPL
ncbi:MAG: triphosphoribosyl-dephospho-CoA synthase [Planctomycetaceae bacterium]